jgi:hypothetical protein
MDGCLLDGYPSIEDPGGWQRGWRHFPDAFSCPFALGTDHTTPLQLVDEIITCKTRVSKVFRSLLSPP